MRIAVASGKGGTGKTAIATGLALSLAAELAPPPLFLDCDVEAPNAHLFLEPQLEQRQDVPIPIPQIDEGKCTYCGRAEGDRTLGQIVEITAISGNDITFNIPLYWTYDFPIF